LPTAFDGIRMVQLSDIHTGSLYSRRAVRGGIEMVLAEKPEVIFFTGDLVNNESSELRGWMDILDKLKAPLGVYSSMGNHDYGLYGRFESQQARLEDVYKLQQAQRQLGWNLLLNEHRSLTVEGASIALLGVENWGKGRFPKYGKLGLAHQHTADFPVKILLSHDPSHWDLEILPGYKDIDLTLSGHTHGMQFGVEVGDFRWSPSQYVYQQWAGLYEKQGQYLYVNRGFGYIGFPGRVGILPEITLIELKKA
jgi:predicted MPP superfamily phosphohydrolase